MDDGDPVAALRAPRRRRLVGGAVLTFVWGFASTSLFMLSIDPSARAAAPAWGVSVGVLLAVGVVALLRRTWRGGGDPRGFAQRAEAVRTGVLPDDADPATWLPPLRKQRDTLWKNRWLFPALAVLQLVTGGLQLAHRRATPDVLFWVLDVVTYVGLGAWSFFVGRPRLRTVRDLLRRLGDPPE